MSIIYLDNLQTIIFHLQRNKNSSAVTSTSTSQTQHGKKSSCSSSTRLNQNQSSKSRQPLRAREVEKNRRLGAVQTPPPRRQPSRTYQDMDSSVMYRNSKFGEINDSAISACPRLCEPECLIWCQFDPLWAQI